MQRAAVLLSAVGAALVLAGCVGSTDPATQVRATQARLNAHGHTDNGPARWWWEYSTSQGSVQNGTGTSTPKSGPASSAVDVTLGRVVTGLSPRTTYFFRACGQDASSPTARCANIRSFTTTGGDSAAGVVSGGELILTSAAATANRVNVTRFVDADGVTKYKLEDLVSDDRVDGSSIVPGVGCASFAGRVIDDAVKCPAGGITRIHAVLGDLRDQATVDLPIIVPATLEGGDDIDVLNGGGGGDLLIGGPGSDGFNGRAGDDTLYTFLNEQDQDFGLFCGDGFDTVVYDNVDVGPGPVTDGKCETGHLGP